MEVIIAKGDRVQSVYGDITDPIDQSTCTNTCIPILYEYTYRYISTCNVSNNDSRSSAKEGIGSIKQTPAHIFIPSTTWNFLVVDYM